MPNQRKVGIFVDDLHYSWRDEQKSISPSSIVLLVVFVSAAAFLASMVWFRPWVDESTPPAAPPPAEAQAPAPPAAPAPQAPPPQVPAAHDASGAPAGP